MHIQDLSSDNQIAIEQVAILLVEGFKEHWPDAWPTFDAAVKEVNEGFAEGRISRIAIDTSGLVLGWIGAQPAYAEVWELHRWLSVSINSTKGSGVLWLPIWKPKFVRNMG